MTVLLKKSNKKWLCFDDLANETPSIMQATDGIIIGFPVYY